MLTAPGDATCSWEGVIVALFQLWPLTPPSAFGANYSHIISLISNYFSRRLVDITFKCGNFITMQYCRHRREVSSQAMIVFLPQGCFRHVFGGGRTALPQCYGASWESQNAHQNRGLQRRSWGLEHCVTGQAKRWVILLIHDRMNQPAWLEQRSLG